MIHQAMISLRFGTHEDSSFACLTLFFLYEPPTLPVAGLAKKIKDIFLVAHKKYIEELALGRVPAEEIEKIGPKELFRELFGNSIDCYGEIWDTFECNNISAAPWANIPIEKYYCLDGFDKYLELDETDTDGICWKTDFGMTSLCEIKSNS